MGRIQKILVPVDGSVNGCKAVDEAIFFAEKCKADLDFVYVASNINKDIPSHIVFDRIWEKLPDDIKASKHVETGNIPKAIMRVAAEEHSDLIIMGSRGLGLFKGALIGSVSQKVVEESPIPVMVIKYPKTAITSPHKSSTAASVTPTTTEAAFSFPSAGPVV